MRSFIHKMTGWLRTSLFTQLFLPIIAMAVAVFLINVVMGNLFFRETLVNSARAAEENYLEMQAGNTEQLLSGYGYMLYGAAVDSDLLSMAKRLCDAQSTQRSAVELYVREYLKSAISFTDICAATLALPDGGFVSYTRLQDAHNWPSWFSITGQDGYDDALAALCERAQAAGKAVVGVEPARYTRRNICLIHMACPVLDLVTRTSYGTLVYSVNTVNLCQTVNPTAADDRYAQGILTDADGVILAHADQSLAYQTLAAFAGDPAADVERGILPRDPLILRRDLNRFGFTLYRVVDQNQMLMKARRYGMQQSALVSLILAALLTFMGLLLRRMLRSIHALRQGINAASGGDLEVRVPVTDEMEIGQITQAFNHMAGQLSQAQRREAEQSRRALEALNRQRVAEIKMLENQINSHFLYNTLNTINFTAIESGSLKTSRQIKHLANMLRYTFQQSDSVVDASQEANWLEEYLALQKLRFGNSFDYAVRVDPTVADWPMRKLIAQPFVENSILHGFEGIESGGLLTVDFLPYREGLMRVVIRDNGRGMPPEQVARLNARFADQTIDDAGGIGLENARQRLSSYYGGKARVLFRAWTGKGCVVVLILPRDGGEALANRH